MDNGRWEVAQELMGVTVSTTVFTEETMPYRVVMWSRVDDEDYGRGEVEKYLGDLLTLESGTMIIKEGAAAASKVIFLVNPNGTVKARDLAETPNGGFAVGTEGEVGTIKADKYYDFRGLLDFLAGKQRDLSFAFLLNSSIQRQGERVTAEEIRLMAQELEDSFGATYALLADSLQLPVGRMLLRGIKNLPEIFQKYSIHIVVSTGIEGLGRVHELNRLASSLQLIAQVPDGMRFLKMQTLLRKIFSLNGVGHSGLVKSPAEIQQEQQQAQTAQMMQAGIPNAVKGVADGLNQQNQGAQ